ncbi:glycine C-acetyltransferase [Flavobacteriaceae bacterium]|nr:glycine C-acetyltransferase [Flavobacteriaceae bacterium]MDC1459775.1 glycine C-acetyltransferase [Flavobacteriaceae bacterium]MDC3221216.1 glycine C-acetyltransferase [Flavobacteriaceae bacterium]|tara:strand:- start:819 stop:2003 length:1185 start_codon:yes stop_codon:yes gene_type:complete
MYESIQKRLIKELDEIKISGRYKNERIINSSQGSTINVDNSKVLNFCANNYLGLASNNQVIKRAKDTLESHGFGMASVRFICGTQDIHKELELKISEFLKKEDTILYAAAFDANGGLFEPLFNDQDAIISDALNHASIIDGIRLCKAKRFRYKHNDMEDLELQLKNSNDCRSKIIVTDGVFSMDGTIAQLDKICELANKYDALVMSDECHSTGFVGPTGRGVPEELNVIDQVDIVTGTLGKALGGASGGFTSGPKEIIDILRQKSRPYLFSNTLAPSIVGASLGVLDVLENDTSHLKKLKENTKYFRQKISKFGFDIKPGNHPIVPVMLYDDHLAQEMSSELLKLNIYVIGFFYPVVPKGQARIRVQISASHSIQDIDKALNAFYEVGKKLKVI